MQYVQKNKFINMCPYCTTKHNLLMTDEERDYSNNQNTYN
jgi:hypothetical protein